jgi:hypothetical protein
MMWGRAAAAAGLVLWMVVAPFANDRGYPVGRAWRMYDGYGIGTCRVVYRLDDVEIDRLEALGVAAWPREPDGVRRVMESQLGSDFARVCRSVAPGTLEQRAECATRTRWRAVERTRRSCPEGRLRFDSLSPERAPMPLGRPL